MDPRHRAIDADLRPHGRVARGGARQAGTLVEVMPAWRSIDLGVYAVYPSRKFVAPKVRLMIEFLVHAFRVRAWPA